VSWIAAIVLVPLGLVLVMLALPFHASARGVMHLTGVSGTARIAWAFGLAAVTIRRGGFVLRLAGLPVLRGRSGRGRRERRREKRDQEPEKGGKSAPARVRSAFAHRGALVRMALRLVRALHLRLRVRGRVGTGDPADTAAISGLLLAARSLPGVGVEVETDWLDEVLEGEAEGSARVWVPELTVVAALLLLAREHRAAVRALAA
jgi:hypothetical protein